MRYEMNITMLVNCVLVKTTSKSIYFWRRWNYSGARVHLLSVKVLAFVQGAC